MFIPNSAFRSYFSKQGVRTEYYHSAHKQPCCKCNKLLEIGKRILDKGYCTLSSAFRSAFPTTKYTAERARRALLQIPLVAVRIGNPSDGNAYTILMEKYQGVSYAKISCVLEDLSSTAKRSDINLDKTCTKMLLALASSDREREALRYAIFKASGVSLTEARRRFGFESMSKRANKVEQVLKETDRVREAIDDIAQTQDKAMLESIGIPCEMSSEDESDKSDTEECLEVTDDVTCELLKTSLESSNFNWFECFHQLESQFSSEKASKLTATLPERLPGLSLRKEQEILLLNSYHAFLADNCDMHEQKQEW